MAATPTVLITGLGLMGGSLAAALTRAGWPVLLHHHRPETARRAEGMGLGRAVETFAEAADADLAVVCTPVSTITAVVRAIAAATSARITDVGSTKGSICRELADLGDRFIGSHPMCGSHRTGLDAGDPQLYQDRLVILTPSAAANSAATQAAFGAMWQAAGARLLALSPDDHDRVVAEASHLPHVLANVTASLLTDAAVPACAGGFRDSTRIAGAAPGLWVDILSTNREAVTRLTRQARARLDDLERILESDDREALHRWLAAGQAGRRRYESGKPSA